MKISFTQFKPKNSVCVVDNVGGSYLPIAHRLSEHFDKVYYHSINQNPFPRVSLDMIGTGYDNIERIDEFWKRLDDFDIIVFPDIYFNDFGYHLRKIGKKVWGGTEAEQLETDRKLFKQELKNVGLEVANTKYITGIDNLVNELKNSENKWIKLSYYRGEIETSKHIKWSQSEIMINNMKFEMGPLASIVEFCLEDNIDSIAEIGYDGWCVNGKMTNGQIYGLEVKDCGYIGKASNYSEIPTPIKLVNDKFASVLQKYNHTGFYSTEVRYCKDGKTYYTDPCFSDDTEVLTNNGWKLFENIKDGDTFATLNTTTGYIEYQKSYDFIKSKFEGNMISISNKRKTIDKLVTPNHMVWRTDRNKKGLFTQRADQLTDRGYIPRAGKWIGIDTEYFEIPAYSKKWYSGLNNKIYKEYNKESVKIKMSSWVKFMGWYLSEGNVDDYNVVISQTKYRDQVREVLNELPFNFGETERSFRISSIQLVEYLKDFGLCYEKYIPDYIKELTPELIEIFLHNFCLGDGSHHKGNRYYYSTSERMSNDITELIFKINKVANIIEYPTKGTTMSVRGGKEYIRNHNKFVITECKNTDYYFDSTSSDYITEVPYNGYVYDVTVPNHTLYVRRNGKPFWSSNCVRSGSPPSNVYMKMVSNWNEIIDKGTQGILVEPKFVAKYGCEIILKSNYCNGNTLPVIIPDEYKENVALKGAYHMNGKDYVIPFLQAGIKDMESFGSVVVIGDNLDEIMNKAIEIANSIDAPGLYFAENALEKAKETLNELKNNINVQF